VSRQARGGCRTPVSDDHDRWPVRTHGRAGSCCFRFACFVVRVAHARAVECSRLVVGASGLRRLPRYTPRASGHWGPCGDGAGARLSRGYALTPPASRHPSSRHAGADRPAAPRLRQTVSSSQQGSTRARLLGAHRLRAGRAAERRARPSPDACVVTSCLPSACDAVGRGGSAEEAYARSPETAGHHHHPRTWAPVPAGSGREARVSRRSRVPAPRARMKAECRRQAPRRTRVGLLRLKPKRL